MAKHTNTKCNSEPRAYRQENNFSMTTVVIPDANYNSLVSVAFRLQVTQAQTKR